MITPNSQAGRLLLRLQGGHSVNRLSSFAILGILELSARIVTLEAHGFKINKIRKQVVNRFDEKVSIVEYSLEAS